MATLTGSRILAVFAVAGLFGCAEMAGHNARSGDANPHECTPDDGFDLGESGASYRHRCPPDLQANFHAAYLNGHALFLAENHVTRLEGAIEKRARRIQDMQQEMQRAVDALVAPDTATTDRLFLLERTRTLSEEHARLREEIDRLNAETTVKRIQLEALRHTLALSS